MRTKLAALIVTLGVASGSLSATVGDGSGADLWQAAFVACSPEVCGGYPQNVANLAMRTGRVTVRPTGLVKVKVDKLTDLSGAVMANKTLEVFLGSFGAGFAGESVGTITTDDRGNYEGTVDAGGGVPFVIPPSTTVSAQFILNDPGIRSEFVTGFTVR
jgi:hypothetical protein